MAKYDRLDASSGSLFRSDNLEPQQKEGPMKDRQWLGRAVHISRSQAEGSRVPVVIEVSEEAARKLSLSIKRLKQTYAMGLLPEVEELELALDWVLTGDPRSAAEHRRMEASKGMPPDGGYREPE